MSFFSVIIPLYNKQDYVLATLSSTFKQTFRDFEIIIIDDGSTDNSINLVKKIDHPAIRIIHQKNQGVSAARNTGIAASKGTYIVLLDADDLWLPNHLESLHQLIYKFPEAGLYCCRYATKYSSNYTKDIILSRPISQEMTIIDDYFASSMINPIAWISAVAFQRETFQHIGCFDTKLRTAEDVDLFVRFALNYPVAFCNRITMIYNKNTNHDSLSKVEYNNERDYFVNKYLLEEKTHSSLKLYLDQNRFAIAIRSKICGDTALFTKLLQNIDQTQLNTKQKVLLKSPALTLRFLAKTHHWLIKNKIYIKPLR